MMNWYWTSKREDDNFDNFYTTDYYLYPMAAPEYDSYRKLKVLGEGAFGKALLVEDIRDG